MNTLTFRYILEVERTRSITQAAENLFIAQPNLSKSLRELEESIGFEIFSRTSKGVIPTEKGMAFIEHARKIVTQLDEIEILSHPEKGHAKGLNIAIPQVCYISDGLSGFISDFDSSGGMEINILQANSMQILREVAEGNVSFGILRFSCEYEKYFYDYFRDKGFRNDILWDFEYGVLMPASNPLSGSACLHGSELENCTEITHGSETIPYIGSRKTSRTLSKKHISINDKYDSIELLSGMEDAYMISPPIPSHIMERYNLIWRSLYNAPRGKDILVCLIGNQYSQLEKKLIDLIFHAKNQVAFDAI